MFEEQVGPLVDAGYRVVTWDMRGHGRSQPLGSTPVEVADLTDDLIAILDHLEVDEPVCAAGQSLGGYVAQDLLRRAPERVSTIVVIGSVSTTATRAWWERWALRSSPWWFRPWPWEHLKRTVARATAERPWVRAYAYASVSAMTKSSFLAVWTAVSRALRPEPEYRISVPFLLLHGDRDATGTVARDAPGWASRAPRCRYEAVPEAGHNANQDNARFVNEVLLAFLAEHQPSTRTS